MNYAFITWKKTLQNLKHREHLITSIQKHLVKNSMRMAFLSWKKADIGLQMVETAEVINQEKMQADTAGHLLRQVTLKK